MRAAICASCLVLALAGDQKPADVYASAIATYIAGDAASAFNALARLSHQEIQKSLETSLADIKAHGITSAGRRRVEALAMLHTEYALFSGVDLNGVLFQIDMARLALSVSRLTLVGQVPNTKADDLAQTREFIPRWCAFASSVALTYGSDQTATTIVNEALKVLPDNEELLYWRGIVLEFQAVWVGVPATDPRAAAPGMAAKDGSGFDLLTNTRLWGPVEEAYRRALTRDPDNPETHLHLGYAMYSLRNDAGAKTEIELARDRSTDPFVVYLADLLLARMKEDQNDAAGAAQDYERAIAKMPSAQNAYIGLGLLEARRGNAQRARELTARLAAIPEKQRVRDPWWAFHTTRVPEGDLDWLRKAVRQ